MPAGLKELSSNTSENPEPLKHNHSFSKTTWIVCLLLISVLWSCSGNYTPRPRGYLRIDLPEKQYRAFDSVFPYAFDYPVYCQIVADSFDRKQDMKHRFNMVFNDINGTIHMTYVSLKSTSLDTLIEESVDFVYRHTPKATTIIKTQVNNPESRVFGTIFSIHGKNVASTCQFYVTDSLNHFLRGSLYFRAAPDNDSLKPVVDYVRKDIDQMIKTLHWK
jgi:gliding motility-associated lipoprotein GldD